MAPAGVILAKAAGGCFSVLARPRKNSVAARPFTTNNQMELMAVIMGLEALKKPCRVVITTDSKYVLSGITEWMPNWKKRNWKTASKKPVLNAELWRRLDALASQHEISWQWVKGHSGHPENEIADQLANRGIDELIATESGG